MSTEQAFVSAISVLAAVVGVLFWQLIAKYKENETFRKPLEDAHSAALAKLRDKHGEEIVALRKVHSDELVAVRELYEARMKENKAERDALAQSISILTQARFDDTKAERDRMLQSMETQTKTTHMVASALDGNKQALVGLQTMVSTLDERLRNIGGPRK